ncbi:MAG: M28 family peptidase [Bacteroidetes bacterium]|nr:M28 family peptidase [Bacteroidota bacterium]
MKYLQRFSLFVAAFFLLVSVRAQDAENAMTTMNALCASNMHGRGYVNHGDSLAANYIASRFEGENALSFNGNYFQNFSFNVNTFPNEMQLSIDGKDLVQGYHFLVDAASSSIKGTYELAWADSATIFDKRQFRAFKKNLKSKVIAFDVSSFRSIESRNKLNVILSTNKFHAKAIILVTKSKLTWSAEQTQLKYAQFIVKADKINRNNKSITFNVDAQLIKNYQTRNVIGYIRGSDYPDKYIIISAHYDHLGRMGKYVYFPGANDNASGIAMMLDFMRLYRFQPPKYTIVFIAFAGEEAGLVGSRYYTEHPIVPLEKTHFVLNLDLMGTGKNGIAVVNATVFPKEMSILLEKEHFGRYNLPILQRGKAANSDHYWFSEKGVHSFFIYQLGEYTYYHDLFDSPDQLHLEGYNASFFLLRDFLREIQDRHM